MSKVTIRELTAEEIDHVSGGGTFGVASGVMAVAAAAVGVLAFVAAAPMTVPLTVAAGATAGVAGVLAMIDAGTTEASSSDAKTSTNGK